MTVSPVSKTSKTPSIAVAALVLCAVLSGTGWAQDAPPPSLLRGPVRLAPPKTLAPPVQLREPKTVIIPAPPVEAQSPGNQPGGDQIEVNTLQTIDRDAVGALSAEQGGLGAAMWAGTSRELVNRLLPRLPVNTTSSAMRDLLRRLLLSVAASPKGPSGGPSLVVLRAKLLADMGDNVGVNQLLNAMPGRSQDEQLMRIEADARFLANDNARACALAAGRIGGGGGDYWQKAFIFCQALAGEKKKAALGTALLRELGDEDTVFLSLVEALINGEEVVIDSLPDPSPLHLAMARVARASLPADVMSSNHPSVLSAIAVNPNASVELRLDAAERAEAAGALSVDTLRQLYTSVTFSDEDMANPLSKAEAESGPLSRALLYRTSLIQTVPTAQAETLARALSLARQGGRYASTARVFMPVLKRIPPSAELVWFAPEAARALLAAGEAGSVGTWFNLLRSSAMFNKESDDALKALMPVARLADAVEADNWSTEELDGWWAGEKTNDGARERAELLYSLFEGLNEPVPSWAWDALLGGSERTMVAMPHPALWYRLKEAAEASAQGERRGETVLLCLLALGEGGPRQANPMILRRILASLRMVGLESEAMALALEAALAASL